MSVEQATEVKYVAVQPPPRLTVRLIRDTVAKYYHLTPADMQSARRVMRLSHPRQAAMYLCRKLTGQSFPQIGAMFGDRDHTTVMHACKVIEARLKASPELEEDLQRLEATLTNRDAGSGI